LLAASPEFFSGGSGYDPNPKLSGTLPSLLNQTRLKTLHFKSPVGFSGTLPSFEGLRKVRTLRLYNHEKLSGTLPSFGAMTSLYELYISGNLKLSGTLPSLESQSQLAIFQFKHWDNESPCLMSGTLPQLSACTNLQRLYFEALISPANSASTIDNQCPISGTIPPLSTINKLITLQLVGFKIDGAVQCSGSYETGGKVHANYLMGKIIFYFI